MSNPNEPNEKCNCGCEEHTANCTNESNQDEAIVTLTMEDDSEVDCAVIAIYPVEDKEYIALLPLDEDGDNEDGEVFLYRYSENDGEPILENIEDDDEYEVAAEAFDEVLDEAEFDEE